MSSTSKLRIAYCDRKYAREAVRRWHYSTGFPTFKTACFGVWQDAEFIGAVVYGSGTAPNIEKPFGCKHHEVIELVRVALNTDRKKVATSKVVAITMRLLKRDYDGLRVVVSYADQSQGHHGGIYQAMGWYYVGQGGSTYFIVNGKPYHSRSLHKKYGSGGNKVEWLRRNLDPQARSEVRNDKHKYVWLFDKSLKHRLDIQPYPKRCVSSDTSDTPSVP